MRADPIHRVRNRDGVVVGILLAYQANQMSAIEILIRQTLITLKKINDLHPSPEVAIKISEAGNLIEEGLVAEIEVETGEQAQQLGLHR